MKKTISILLMLVFAASISFAGNQVVFKINVAKSNNCSANEMKRLKMLEYSSYIDQSGIISYFLTDEFTCIKEAEAALEQQKNMGFKNSEIRVYKSGKLLSISSGLVYISEAKKEHKKYDKCHSEEEDGEKNHKYGAKPMNQVVEQDSVLPNGEVMYNGIKFQDAIYGKQDAKNAHVDVVKGEITTAVKVNRIKLMLWIDNNSNVEENDTIKDIIKYDLRRNDLSEVVYRIEILKTEGEQLSDLTYSKMDSLLGTVKVFKKTQEKIYTTSYFNSPLDSNEELEKVTKIGFNAQLVGEYKGIIITEELANLIAAAK